MSMIAACLHGLARRALLILVVANALALPARAQDDRLGGARAEIAAVSRALDDLEARWDANNAGVSRADLDAWSKRAAGSGDLQVIFRFYRLFTLVAERDGNLLAQMGGRVHVALVRHAMDGALTSTAAYANFELGQSFLARDGFRDAGQFALMNALSVVSAFVRTGVREPEIIGVQAMSNALLGQSLLQVGGRAPRSIICARPPRKPARRVSPNATGRTSPLS